VFDVVNSPETAFRMVASDQFEPEGATATRYTWRIEFSAFFDEQA